MLKKILVSSLSLLLAACSANSASSPESAAPTPSTPSASSSPTPIPTSSPTPSPTIAPKHTAKMKCTTDGLDEVIIDAADIKVLEQAWASKEKLDCGWWDNYIGAETPIEKSALAETPYDGSDISTLYSMCIDGDNAEKYPQSLIKEQDLSPDQAKEVSGMLILCPTHPFASELRDAILKSADAVKAKENGTQFPDGTYLVDKDIKPGTYVVTNVENCYWERQDKNGNIIDNYVTMSALRVQVKIRSSDYAFFSSGCGEWKKA
jgi:hypothetical protein